MAKHSFFQILKDQFSGKDNTGSLIADISEQMSTGTVHHPEQLESWKKLVKMPAETRREVIVQLIIAFDEDSGSGAEWVSELIQALLPGHTEGNWATFIQHIQMMRHTDAQFELAHLFATVINRDGAFIKRELLTLSLKHLYIKLKKKVSHPTEFQQKTLEELGSPSAGSPDGLYRELFTDRYYGEFAPVTSQLLKVDDGKMRAILKLCLAYDDKSAPLPKWIKEVTELDQDIDKARLAVKVVLFLGKWCEILRFEHKNLPNQQNMWRNKPEIPAWVSPFIWYAGHGLSDKPGIRQVLSDLADLSFKKIPGIGPLSVKTGNACIHAFALMPDNSGIIHILRQQKRAVNKTVRGTIEKVLQKLASRDNLTPGALMEIGIPDFGLDENGMAAFDFGEYEAVLSVENNAGVLIRWMQRSSLKTLKSAPVSVKKEQVAAYKALATRQSEIKDALGGISRTLESAWLEKRTWTYAQLTDRLLNHPVLKFISRRLVWRLESGAKITDAIFHEGNWHTPEGIIEHTFAPDTRVTLWHPILVAADEVLAWRNWLEERQITQPFKQAYREVYVVTPPEVRTNSYSNRFAAHVLRQHQFAALCGLRGWHYKLQGDFYNPVTPHKEVPSWEYRIEFWIETNDLDDTLDSGIYQYVYTDQVRFSHQGRQVNMPDVPPVVFSELMRDVDLFVGVCSIGNDPNWQDSGNQRLRDYWNRYAFAEELSASGEVRLEALKKMIPRLKIAPQCHFEGRYLLVQGTRHLYKIHCGSGNILMSPNDKYLCIVPDQAVRRDKEPIYLPFEGDTLLSVIISKAILLASDEKITDPTILLQL